MSRRLSLGGGAFRDASSLHNTRSNMNNNGSSRCTSRSRRMSMGGGALRSTGAPSSSFSQTPRKDRHAMLEEYRQQKRAREDENAMDDPNEYYASSIKASRPTTAVAPPHLPPVRARASPARAMQRTTSASTTATDSLTALERFRLHKQRRQQEQQLQQQQSLDSSFESTNANSSFSFSEDYVENLGSSRLLTRRQSVHPSSSNNSIGHNRSLSTASRPNNMPSLSQESAISHDNSTDGTLSQLSQDTTAAAENMARYEIMQKRLRELEEEKVGITIAMAPVEARHRQKEDAWIKEQNRLVQEIDDLKDAGQKADERYRDLEAQYEAKEEENRELRAQIRKESSTKYSDSSTTGWSRHLQVERDLAELKEKLQCAEEEIKEGRMLRVSIEKELHATKIERDSILRAYEELQDEYDEVSKTTSDEREAQIKLEVLTTEHIATSAQLNAVCSDLAATKAAYAAEMENKDLVHADEMEKMQFEMSVLKTRAGTVVQDPDMSMSDQDVEDFAVLKARIEERDRKIAEFEKERLAWEAMRRQMHNRIQELRGNIRVFVRTRPFLPNDGGESVSAIDVSPDGETLCIVDARTTTPHDFKFDKVFPPSSGQDLVFQEVADFVQSALDGYHVCLFSYGQTGSGKTHTMQGSGNGAMRGIIPRAVEQILIQAKEMHGQNWTFQVSASFLEIYNEELKDLLVDMGGNDGGGSSRGSRQIKLSIKRSRGGKSYVDGLTEVPIETVDSAVGMGQLDELMNVAARSRSVASTKMNAQSSRSHSVFMLHLRGYNEESGAEVSGALNLCDLAGSERLDRSGASADAKRLRETQAINKSLSCLGDVFNALSQKSSHIPYRNSKLTYLLQDCLSGDGKALMFVNLSPTTASSNESLCSLRFAQRVNQVELGKATKHIHYNR